jgi:FKBP-type peptidyl-prolyl cis-trans isomerase FkpA
MKLKNLIAVLLLIVSVQVMAQDSDLKRLPNGLQYKIYTSNAGPKIKLNDVITFNFLQKTDKDSLLGSSFSSNRPAVIQVQPAQSVADLMDFFPLLAANDSAMVRIPTDSIFSDPQMQRPPFLPKGSSLVMIVKINRVQSMEEAMAERQKQMDELKGQEVSSLARYLAENKIAGVKTASGLHYLITKPSAKAKPAKGDTVLVNYTGRTLDGKVFDSSVEAEAKKAGLEQPGRTYEPISVVLGSGSVIPGWEESLLLVNEGAKAKVIIPSSLAYGEQGAGADIKPFSTLVFDLELVKVKRVKKAAPVASKSVPAKKPVAKKPATKSTTTKSTATKKN